MVSVLARAFQQADTAGELVHLQAFRVVRLDSATDHAGIIQPGRFKVLRHQNILHMKGYNDHNVPRTRVMLRI